MFKLTQVDFSHVNFVWPEAEKFLRNAVDETASEESYLRNMKARVFSGLNQLWRIEDNGKPVGYAITVCYTTDGVDHIVQVFLGSGSNVDGFLTVFDQFESWARRVGVSYIEIIGRKGWEKTMKPYGFRHNYTALIKSISKGLH